MLGEPVYTLNELFAQLGLDSSDEAIDKFISEHKLNKDQSLIDADFWTDSQRAFLKEEWKRDAAWVEIIDDLNVRLHPTA
ncbi:DUF2789 domain-containing protein [Psychrobacter sanguinis]|uniref:DUF2789 domain-containing protein n=1 Tax=Psychrobacter sanguinis TaxID=861445 RepID=UPI00020C7EF8|nr:DUF2789 domain-containing protein [Psychrobacter sanguinis]EGK09467.1 hypothetical protein HMPREF9373_2173 [Psychrobacter sp. 1501(2011)]MCD9152356.1 DUF2789 domain-containing protein [Psychrobacter sanguinis]